jgi:hypothetical protein
MIPIYRRNELSNIALIGGYVKPFVADATSHKNAGAHRRSLNKSLAPPSLLNFNHMMVATNKQRSATKPVKSDIFGVNQPN